MNVPIVAYKLVSLKWKEEYLKYIILRSFRYKLTMEILSVSVTCDGCMTICVCQNSELCTKTWILLYTNHTLINAGQRDSYTKWKSYVLNALFYCLYTNFLPTLILFMENRSHQHPRMGHLACHMILSFWTQLIGLGMDNLLELGQPGFGTKTQTEAVSSYRFGTRVKICAPWIHRKVRVMGNFQNRVKQKKLVSRKKYWAGVWRSTE